MRLVFKKMGTPVLRTAVLAMVFFVFFASPVTAEALLQLGTQAPDFTLKDTEWQDVSLARYSGEKAVVLLFWSTWSTNSPKALKRFEEYYSRYKDKGIQVIGINADNQTLSREDIGSIKKLMKEAGVTFPVLLDRGLDTFHNYNVIALPSTVVISGGKVSYTLPGLPLVGTEDMFDYLLTLAGEQPRKKVEPKFKARPDAIADTGLARQFISRKQYAMAYPLLQKAIEKDPKYIAPYVELAKLYAVEGKNAEAEEILKKALASEPGNVVASSELGYLLSRTGRAKEAIGILSSALGKENENDSYTPAHYYLAYALGMDDRLEEALKVFARAVSLNPFDPMTYRLRGEIYERSNMLKEAASDYRKALELIAKIKD